MSVELKGMAILDVFTLTSLNTSKIAFNKSRHPRGKILNYLEESIFK
jgi:hypothetical protein